MLLRVHNYIITSLIHNYYGYWSNKLDYCPHIAFHTPQHSVSEHSYMHFNGVRHLSV